jgi:glutathione S-transferase
MARLQPAAGTDSGEFGMLTLYHAPRSRSTRIIQLAIELRILDRIEVKIVNISRHDGSGSPDPVNPHPERKVPTLVHDGETIWESPAVILYLTDLFPEAGFAPAPGMSGRGTYLSWLAWYGDVLEPVLIFDRFGISHPALEHTFRTMREVESRLADALSAGPWLLGEMPSAADLLISSAFIWSPEATPQTGRIPDWVRRCAERPSAKAAADYDGSLAEA